MWRWGSGTEAEDDVGWPFRVALFCVRRQGDQFWTRNGPPAVSLAGRSGGPFLVAVEAPVVMVGTDRAGVEVALRAGELCCPCCRGALVPWGHARERVLRGDRHGRELMGPAFSGQLFSGISCCELAAQVLVVDLVWGLV